MTARTIKPKCVLVDANIVIKAYEIGIWLEIVSRCEIIVPSIVVHREALFYSEKKQSIPKDIDLMQLVEQGRIKEVTATKNELEDLYKVFDRVFVEQIDDGEAEALALLKAGKTPQALFCTGDAPAIKALAMIGQGESGISLESLLGKLGLQKSLNIQFTQTFFEEHLKRGSKNLITGQGLAHKK